MTDQDVVDQIRAALVSAAFDLKESGESLKKSIRMEIPEAWFVELRRAHKWTRPYEPRNMEQMIELQINDLTVQVFNGRFMKEPILHFEHGFNNYSWDQVNRVMKDLYLPQVKEMLKYSSLLLKQIEKE